MVENNYGMVCFFPSKWREEECTNGTQRRCYTQSKAKLRDLTLGSVELWIWLRGDHPWYLYTVFATRKPWKRGPWAFKYKSSKYLIRNQRQNSWILTLESTKYWQSIKSSLELWDNDSKVKSIWYGIAQSARMGKKRKKGRRVWWSCIISTSK
jgi:hypothetical protein